MTIFNLHTHSNYCDGSDHPEAYLKVAIDLGYDVLGFSSHAPVPFENKYAIPDEDILTDYCQTIKRLQNQYNDKIQVLLSLEMDYIPGITRDFISFESNCRLDYSIGSIHFVRGVDSDDLWFIDGPWQEKYDEGLKKVFQNNIKKAVSKYFHQVNEMVLYQKPDIIGHLDKIKMHNRERYFSEEDHWYRKLIMESLELIRDSDSIVEINTRGAYKGRSDSLFPDNWILGVLNDFNIPVTISTDAHKPSELNLQFNNAIERIREYGFGEVMIYRDNDWKAIPIK